MTMRLARRYRSLDRVLALGAFVIAFVVGGLPAGTLAARADGKPSFGSTAASDPCERSLSRKTSARAVEAKFAKLRARPAAEREQMLLGHTDEVDEFRFIAELANRYGYRAWLMGGAASTYSTFKIDQLRAGLGDRRFYPQRFDHPLFFQIFAPTQDFDVVIDTKDAKSNIGAAKAKEFEDAINERFPYKRGSHSAWEVRLLREKINGKQALIDNPDFLGAHNDTLSTALLCLNPSSHQHVYSELRDPEASWEEHGPDSFEDIWDRTIHYLYSDKHGETTRAREGKNPEIFSAIRFLTKRYREDLQAPSEDLAQIRAVVTDFSAVKDIVHEYAIRWLGWAPKKLMQSAADVAAMVADIDQMGLRQKMLEMLNPEAKRVIVAKFTEAAGEKLRSDLVDDNSLRNLRSRLETAGEDQADALRQQIAARRTTLRDASQARIDRFIGMLDRVTDLTNPESMVSWLRREPLRPAPLGRLGTSTADPRLAVLTAAGISPGKTAGELGIDKVVRVIPLNDYLTYDLLYRARAGLANVYLDEPVASATGIERFATFRTWIAGHVPASGPDAIEAHVEFRLDPKARDGVDFIVGDQGSNRGQVGFLNRSALRVMAQSLHWPTEPYFAALTAGHPPAGTDEAFWARYEQDVFAELRAASASQREEAARELDLKKLPDDELVPVLVRLRAIYGRELAEPILDALLERPSLPPKAVEFAAPAASSLGDAKFARWLKTAIASGSAKAMLQILSGDRLLAADRDPQLHAELLQALGDAKGQAPVVQMLIENPSAERLPWRHDALLAVANLPTPETAAYLGAWVKSRVTERGWTADGTSNDLALQGIATEMFFATWLVDSSIELAKIPAGFWKNSKMTRILLDRFANVKRRDYDRPAAAHADDNAIRKAFAAGVLDYQRNPADFALLKTFVDRERNSRDAEVEVELSLIENLLKERKGLSEEQAFELVDVIIAHQKANRKFNKRVREALLAMLKGDEWDYLSETRDLTAKLKQQPDDGDRGPG